MLAWRCEQYLFGRAANPNQKKPWPGGQESTIKRHRAGEMLSSQTSEVEETGNYLFEGSTVVAVKDDDATRDEEQTCFVLLQNHVRLGGLRSARLQTRTPKELLTIFI